MFKSDINSSKYHYEDFTEDNYSRLLSLAMGKYNFIDYKNYKSSGKNIIWRHDIDFSVHRAHKLAIIENSMNIKTTYFLYLHSFFYNLLEDEIFLLIKKIINLGHDIGLHFDTSFYNSTGCNEDYLIKMIEFEKNFLENILNKKIIAFSLHIPESCQNSFFSKEKIFGMINVSSDYIINNYGYCSDSNGYWRYRRLENVLVEAKDEKLQILTHPELWTPEPMSPRDRITRCIEGRAKSQHKRYDDILKNYGRENIR